MKLKQKLVAGALVAALATPFGLWGYTRIYPYTPAGVHKVEREAREWTERLGYQVIGIAARNDDLGGDGYVSVTVEARRDGQDRRMSIQCVSPKPVMLSWSCREQSLSLDVLKK